MFYLCLDGLEKSRRNAGQRQDYSFDGGVLHDTGRRIP